MTVKLFTHKNADSELFCVCQEQPSSYNSKYNIGGPTWEESKRGVAYGYKVLDTD